MGLTDDCWFGHLFRVLRHDLHDPRRDRITGTSRVEIALRHVRIAISDASHPWVLTISSRARATQLATMFAFRFDISMMLSMFFYDFNNSYELDRFFCFPM